MANRIERVLAADEWTAAAHIRHVVDRMCRLTDRVALLAQARWELDRGLGPATLQALRLYRLEGRDPQDSPEAVGLSRSVVEA